MNRSHTFRKLYLWLPNSILYLLLLTTLIYISQADQSNTVGDLFNTEVAKGPISLLTFAARKRGVLQLPGYFGSLLNNTAAGRVDMYLYTDDIVQDLIHDCIPLLKTKFYNITVKNIRELQDNFVLKYFDKYIKSGELTA